MISFGHRRTVKSKYDARQTGSEVSDRPGYDRRGRLGKQNVADEPGDRRHVSLSGTQTGDFLHACKRAEIFARDAANTVRLRITPGESSASW